ncbi:calmodulin-binding transcription activator 1 isoform X1 [Eubalaena glacialis]|uniref:calmodulin-binding transcription activator 1 isoform X1 n=1 Tax=Eubalaena glacialis TaxID=27606 RepID=UPI002A59FC8B|nr:calmodulin-binding transcription activator 1 isoform X1 [Eubalaena glacialis]
MWRAEGKWLPKTSRKSVSQSVFCGTSTYCVLNTVPPVEDDHGNSNSSHVKIFLPKKLLECLPKCSSLPKERHRWNTNEEIAAYLITFEKHEEWLTTSPKTRRRGWRAAEERQVLTLSDLTSIAGKTTAEWLNDPLQQEESEIQERWVLLEKEERWENDQRGPHETEGPGSRASVSPAPSAVGTQFIFPKGRQ